MYNYCHSFNKHYYGKTSYPHVTVPRTVLICKIRMKCTASNAVVKIKYHLSIWQRKGLGTGQIILAFLHQQPRKGDMVALVSFPVAGTTRGREVYFWSWFQKLQSVVIWLSGRNIIVEGNSRENLLDSLHLGSRLQGKSSRGRSREPDRASRSHSRTRLSDRPIS